MHQIQDKDRSFTNATYRLVVHQDEQENLVITQNPTLWNSPNKSDFIPESVESDETVEAETAEEVTEFLETFLLHTLPQRRKN